MIYTSRGNDSLLLSVHDHSFFSLSLSIVQQFTHIFRFQRFWRAAVVSQELCNLLPQAEREQSGEVS